MTKMRERDIILTLVKMYKPQVYMELGVQRGYTFNAVAALGVPKCIGIDIKPCDRIMRGSGIDLYWGHTDQVFTKVKQHVVDILFIDACHDFTQVARDFANYSQLVRPGTGLILLHDTHPMERNLLKAGYCSDAWKLARLIRHCPVTRKQFEIVSLPGPRAGISIVRKSETILSWADSDYDPELESISHA